ncbi:hypothetical protein FCN18_24535 [Prauserella endophytica]|uniref:Succinylglutamate desuccinylase/Aspartoacylase catalytic domain-containing protein n=2 Tax=Prauserella endophytica TaxID=1592324 RepID=A0ABY2S148_9PSEU|nr:hypothetical protein FCN18_24535 [Prauserella endophytica]
MRMAGPGTTSREESVLTGGAVLTTLRGHHEGPTIALLGGVHGDEDEGVLAVLRLLDEVSRAPLAGTLRAVPRANPVAWAAQSRFNPLDGQNLARCFPGDGDESPTSALAAGITEEVITGADLLVDLHSAGLNYQMPLLCGYTEDNSAAEQSRRAAVAFGAPLIWSHPRTGRGRSLSVAADQGIPAVYAECTGGGAVRSRELDTYVRGVLGIMAEIGMLPETYRPGSVLDAAWVYGDGDLDDGAQSKYDGLFTATVAAGAAVAHNQEIGRLYDYHGGLLETVRASYDGVVMFLRHRARTSVDDVLFVLARTSAHQE